MKNRNLIQLKRSDYTVVCDNTSCDYKVPADLSIEEQDSMNPIHYEKYIDIPCPKCGENLLTKRDFKDLKKLYNLVAFVNKVGSFIPGLIPKKGDKVKEKSVHVKIHNGVHFSKD